MDDLNVNVFPFFSQLINERFSLFLFVINEGNEQTLVHSSNKYVKFNLGIKLSICVSRL